MLNSSLGVPRKGFKIKVQVLLGCSFLPCEILGPGLVCALGDQGQPERHLVSSPWVWRALFLEVCVVADHTDLAHHPGDVLRLATSGSLNSYNAFPEFPAPSSIWLWEFTVTTGGGLLRAIGIFTGGWEGTCCSPSPWAPIYSQVPFVSPLLYLPPLLPSGHRSA